MSSEKDQSLDSKSDLKLSQEPTDEEAEKVDVDAILMEEDPKFINSMNQLGRDLKTAKLADDDLSVAAEATSEVPTTWKERLRSQLNLKKQLAKRWAIIRAWSTAKKVSFGLFLLLVVLLTLGLVQIVKTKLLEQHPPLFLGSFADKATRAWQFNPEKDVELFYNSMRIKVYTFQLKSIMVNLRKREPTGHPMGFFDFVLEGFSREVLVEAKERESEIHDLVSRVVEELDYKTLDTVKGKLELKHRALIEINNILTGGQLRNVQIKQVIIKP